MKILVRVPNWLGDVVMSTAFITSVKRLYPDSTVDIIIKSELKGIAALIPGINQIIPFSKKEFAGLSGVFRFGKSLRPHEYDIFFSLPDSLSSAVMGWATGAKKRVGFGKEGGFFLLTKIAKKPKDMHRVDEYICLLEQFTGKAISNRQVKLNADPNLTKNNLVLINFNSEAESRRMPMSAGINLINKLTNTFKNASFAFIGAPKEADYVNQLIVNSEHANRLQSYAGKTNLAELANLMAESKVLLTTDSGPAHLANSVGTPVIALFGAGNEFNTGPYNKTNLAIIRANRLDCEPCVRNTCQLYGIPKCMELLDEFQIIEALNNYLNAADLK